MRFLKNACLAATLALTVASGSVFAQAPTVAVTEVIDISGTVPLFVAALVAMLVVILTFKLGISLAKKGVAMLMSNGAAIRA